MRLIRNIHYSWFICLSCALLLFCTGGLCVTAFAVYLPYMRTFLGMTNTQVALISFVRSLFGVTGMLFVNRFLMKYEIRRVVTAALVIGAVSFTIYAFCPSFAGCIAAAAISGTAYGLGSMIPVSILISRWFNDRIGLALGICMAATGVAAFIASPVITWAIETFSLKAAFAGEGVFLFVMSVVVHALLRSMPSCLDLEPLGADKDHQSIEYAPKTAPRVQIMLMTAGFLILGMTANNVSGNLSLLYQSAGLDSDRIASIIAFFGISLAIGKCVSGEIVDKIGPFKSCLVLFAISIAGCALCCTAGRTGLTTANAAVILIGFGMAVASIAPSAFAMRVASEGDYPVILSRFQTCQTLGGLIFATIPGIMADAFGSYVISYIVMLGAVIISSMILERTYHKVVCE